MSSRGSCRALIGAGLLLWLASCSQGAGGGAPGAGAGKPGGPAGAGAAAEARAVELHVVEEQAWPRTLRVTGETLPSEAATLAARVPGQLVAWLVERGERVEAGQLLAEIDPVEYRLRVAQAQATLAAARSELGLSPAPVDGEPAPSGLPVDETPIVREALAAFRQSELDRERAEALRSDGITSAGDLDSARLREESAASRLRAARDTVAVRLARLEQQHVGLELALEDQRRAAIVAPFAGAVAERRAGLGEILALGAPLLDLVRFDPLRVRLIVPEQDSGRVALGQAVLLTLDSDATRRLPGTIQRIAPALDGLNRTLWVELELENKSGDLRPGAFVRAEIEFDREHRIATVPAAALVRFAGTVRAYAYVDGRAEERRLTLGRERSYSQGSSEFEVLAGLKPGDEVVLEPGNLTKGQALTRAKAAAGAAEPKGAAESKGAAEPNGATKAAQPSGQPVTVEAPASANPAPTTNPSATPPSR